MKPRIIAVTVLLLILNFISVDAQLHFRKGYVITMKDDTLHGYVNDGGGWRNTRVCLFKTERGVRAMRYKPEDLKAYRFLEDKYYASNSVFYKNNVRKVFTEVLVEGSVDLYSFNSSKKMNYYIRKGEGPLIGLSKEQIQVKPSYDVGNYQAYVNKFVTIEINVYRDSLRSLFRDSETVKSQVDNVNYSPESLINISKSYLNETCKEKQCIAYEKDLKKVRTLFGFYTAVQMAKISYFYAREGSTEIFKSYPVGVFANVPLCQLHDRLSLQFEVNYQKVSCDSGSLVLQDPIENFYFTKTVVGVPIMLKYKIPMRWITPSIGFGKETAFVIKSKLPAEFNTTPVFHMSQRGGWFYELGMSYRLTSNLSAFTNLRYQTYKNLKLESNNGNRSSFASYLRDNPKAYLQTSVIMLQVGLQF
jgi:hypothetical protein